MSINLSVSPIRPCQMPSFTSVEALCELQSFLGDIRHSPYSAWSQEKVEFLAFFKEYLQSPNSEIRRIAVQIDLYLQMKETSERICQLIEAASPIASLSAISRTSPVGISNEGNSCFLAAAVQLLLKDPVLEEALIEEWLEAGPAREFGEFLFHYREAQREGRATISGIGKLRNALHRLSGNRDFMSGQWDANEVLRTLFSDEKSPLFQKLIERKYFVNETVRRYYALPLGYKPVPESDLQLDCASDFYYSQHTALRPAQLELELSEEDWGREIGQLIAHSWKVSLKGSEPGYYKMQDGRDHACTPLYSQLLWDKIPQRLVISLKRFSFADTGVKLEIPLEVQSTERIQEAPFRLVGFTQHSGATLESGHWISFTAEGNRYFRNDDSNIEEIEKEFFLQNARLACDLIYERNKALAHSISERDK